MMHRFSTLVAALTAAIVVFAADRQASVAINNSIKYQHVSGFGGFAPSPTWQYWLSSSDIDRLFGHADDQLGLNICRLYMGNSRSSWSAGIANARRVKSHGAFVFASPWSPPAAWKSNNSSDNGGELLPEHYEDWANFLNDYYLYMQGLGIEIDAVSIQNEPDWKASYQSCIWSGQQILSFPAKSTQKYFFN